MSNQKSRFSSARDACFVLATVAATSFLFFSIQRAATAETKAPAEGFYEESVRTLLASKCLACHSSGSKMGGLVMETYGSLMKGGTHGPALVPGKSGESRMILMLEGKIQPRMPFGSDPLSEAEISTLKAWIDAGAKGPAAGEAAEPLKPLAIPDLKPQVTVASPVVSLKFSPDGKLLAAGGYRNVGLIEAATGKSLATLSGHADYVRSLAFSPAGKLLAAAGGPAQRGGEIKIWDVTTHQIVRTLQGHSDCIYSVAWSPDGKWLASGSYDKMIKLWDAATGQETRTLKDHIDAVFALAFSPDGKLLASGSQDRSVKIWNVATGERLYTLSEPSDGITTIVFSPSGKQLAAAGYDRTIYVWSIGEKSGTLAQSLIADEESILQLAWSPDGKVLISSSADGSIRLRDASTLNPLSVFANQPDWVEALSISPDGKWLAAGRFDGTLSLYDLKSDKQVFGPALAFEPYTPPAKPAAPTRAQAQPGKAGAGSASVNPPIGEVHP